MQRHLVITTSWDDGHPLDMKVAEMLVRFGLPGTFYIPLQSEFGVMEHKDIRDLSGVFEIGAHTINHVYLDSVSKCEARREIVGSKAALEDICSRECRVFCFPGGKFSAEHLQTVKEAGYSAARTVEMMSLRRPELRSGLAVIPTTLQAYPHLPFSYVKNVAKRLRLRNLVPLSLALRAGDLLTATRVLLERSAQDGGVFHLWGHSWEIEALQEWQNLESILRLISSYKSSAKLLSNGTLAAYAG